MQKLQALIFDLEGTIIDTEPAWDDANALFLKRHSVAYNRSEIKHHIMGRSLVEGAAIMKDMYNLPGTPEALGEERREAARSCLAREVNYVDQNFPEFLRLVSQQYPCAIATSLERAFLGAIDHALGLGSLFNGHVYSIEDIGFIGKPAPDIFLHAAKQLGVPPKACLVFEDAHHGIQAAHAAGMPCVALATTMPRDHLAGAERIVDGYGELIKLYQTHQLEQIQRKDTT